MNFNGNPVYIDSKDLTRNTFGEKKISELRATKIFLCDLTHVNGETLSSNVFPLGAGMLGAFLLKSDIGKLLDIEIFKYPDDLNRRLAAESMPNIVGFANYSWTFELSRAFAEAIKKWNPSVITVFGGPNYGLTDEEVNSFWHQNKEYVDFNVILEGEIGFYSLVKSLMLHDFRLDEVKSKPELLKNLHYISQPDGITKTDVAQRIDIEDLPSPYLDTNLMDKFFDGKLIPLTHSTRGCPFKCTFCSEGADYYNKVKQRTTRLYEEYRYIADKSVEVGVYDLMLSDANYGMFKEDSTRADMLARVQSETGFPKHVYVSTGKNQKERVLGAVKKLGGAIQLSASLQTTNAKVLQNIERSNISIEVLSAAAQEALENDVVSYTELILGLPGETLESHLHSIKEVIAAGFVNVRIYQLILLPQTALNTRSTREKYNFYTAMRAMPRSFGNYEILADRKFVAEYEEIVVATSSMTPDHYISCRKIGLLVDILHNGFIFREFQRFCVLMDVTWSDYLEFVFNRVLNNELSGEIGEYLDEFIEVMNSKHFKSLEELLGELIHSKKEERISDLTINELAHFKAQLIFKKFSVLNDFMVSNLQDFLGSRGIEFSRELLNILGQFSFMSKDGFIFDFQDRVMQFETKLEDQSNFLRCIGLDSQIVSGSYGGRYCALTLSHDQEQLSNIKTMVHLNGESDEGLSRVVMRSPILSSYFRKVQKVLFFDEKGNGDGIVFLP
jgi:radical SAM superfamily enzyme YgiQ (UPF0313 family)